MKTKKNTYLLSFLMIVILLILSANSFSEDSKQLDPAKIAQAKPFKISDESIASLASHLSDEKFKTLQSQLLGKEYSKQSQNLEEILASKEFTTEEIQRIRDSIEFYFIILEKINKIAPAILSIAKTNQEIEKKEKSLTTLMNNEKSEVLAKIEELKTQVFEQKKTFKRTFQQLGLDDINFDKLPGMLSDLGYEESFYQVIYEHLSSYLSIAKRITTASSIVESLDEISDDIIRIERQLKTAENEEQKESLKLELQKLIKRKTELKQDFTLNTAGISTTNINEKTGEKINWEDELKKIFSPIIINLKDFTEPARRIELLNTDITYYEQQLPKIQKAIEQLDMLLIEIHSRKIKGQLLLEKEYWEQQEKELNAKYEVAKQQLLELENRKASPKQAFDALTQTIFSKQGRNILLAFLTFLSIFIVLHLIRRIILIINPLNYVPRFKFIANLIDVILNLFIVIISVLSLMVALYMVGSLMTLAIVVFVLLGILWALRNMLPHFVEQIKLLLGYGPVRQGEKVAYNGIQWLVESIGVYSYFRNPLLEGNLIRLPLKDLIGLRSRPFNEDEPWFPSRKGDWVILSDGFYGCVVVQNPDIVQINTLRGSYKSYTPSDYLHQHPRNLSVNLFSVNNILNLDFKHSHIVLNEVSEIVSSMLKEKIEQQFYGKYLKRIIVELESFDNSSLNVITIAQFTGEASSEFFEIGWLLQQVALDACNQSGWTISLNQVAMHQIQPEQTLQPKQLPGEVGENIP